jgi:tungstate transport system permease protein
MPENSSALHLLLAGDPTLFAIVRLSLIVSLSATLVAALIGVRQLSEVILERGRKQHEMIVRVRLQVVGCNSDCSVLPQRDTRSYP